MTPLSAHTVAEVTKHVSSSGLSGQLADELTDHLCCLTEDAVLSGLPVEAALSSTLSTWPVSRLRGVKRQVNYTIKLKPMLLKLIPFAAVCSGLLLLSPFSEPEVTVSACTGELAEYVAEPASTSFDPPTASPIAGVNMQEVLSSGFGMRLHPIKKVEMFHRGIDLKVKLGTPILATADGTVTFAAEDGQNGLRVRIQHADGYATTYCHLQDFTVKPGDVVTTGTQIGAVGNTGASTAPHLHYEVYEDDRPINPLALLD